MVYTQFFIGLFLCKKCNSIYNVVDNAHWKTEIKNSFIRYQGKRLSNGPIEGTNSRIKTILKSANGDTNFNRLRNRIIYSLNKDIPINGDPKRK